MAEPSPSPRDNPFGRSASARYIFVHKDGACFEVSSHKSTPEGVVLYNEEKLPFATIDANELAAVYPLKPDEVLDQSNIPERSRIALAMVKIEQAIEEWKDYRAKSGQRIYRLPPAGEITIFGSASLNITILPQRVSHDFDLATDESFWRILKIRLDELSTGPGDLTLATHSENLLRHSGNWRSRALPIRGTTGLEFLVAHPLDTVSQKMLRIEPQVFAEKDIPDIEKILKILRPPPSIIRSILQEGYGRFFDDIVKPVQAKRRQAYESTDLMPRPASKDWKDLLRNEPLL